MMESKGNDGKQKRGEVVVELIREPSFVDERPFIVIWETTFACDLRCIHCRANAQKERDKDELTFEEARRVIDELSTLKPPPIFILTGGDPFKRDDIMEIIEYSSKKIPTAISPSVTPLFTEDKILKMKGKIKAVSISLDGAEEETHNSFRGEKCFKETIEIIKILKRENLRIQINTTLWRGIIEEIPKLFSMMAEIQPMTWSIFFPVKVGRATDDIFPTAEEVEDIMHLLYDLSEFVHIKTTEGHHFKRIFIQRERGEGGHRGYLYKKLIEKIDTSKFQEKKRRTPMNINDGKGFIFISRQGYIFPSGFLPLNCGSVRERGILDIYKNSPILRTLRDSSKLRGRCGLCEYKDVCSGSRARAFSQSGDYLGEDPLCIYNPVANLQVETARLQKDMQDFKKI